MSRPTLKDQLRALENNDDEPLDPENAYSSLDTVNIGKNAQSRDDYLDVGPSRLRDRIGNGDQVLLGGKYAGKTVKRNKIFDDEESEDDDIEGDGIEDESEEDYDGEDSGGEDEDDGEGFEEDEGELDGGEDNDDEHTAEDEELDDEDENDAELEEEDEPRAEASSSRTTKQLDPVGELRQARAKDVERGKGIRRQKVSCHPLRIETSI